MALPEPVKAYLRWQRNALWRLDKFLNGLTGGNPSVTLSYRFAVWRDEGFWPGCVLCRFLNLFDPDHCTKQRREYDPRP